jgi:ABC-2 type transport system permease protein
VTALLVVELRRIAARRVVRLFVVASVLGIAAGALAKFLSNDATFAYTDVKGLLGSTTVPFVLASWVLGATMIGAEWRAGTIMTTLTWEPRRGRVFVSKALAVMLVAATMFVVFQSLIAVNLIPAASHGTTEGVNAEWIRGVAGLVLRAAALAAIAAAFGFATASAGRNTAFALGVAFVYLAILEGGLLGNIFPGIRRWLLVGNSIVFVTGRSDFDIAGRSAVGAGIVLALYAVGALAAAGAFFATRDVK